jgi:anthranilate phosphoribosyltransferase
VLGRLGAERAWVVHGSSLDEITTAGTTAVAEYHDGAVREFELAPEDVGIPRADLAQLKGGDPAHNAGLMRDLLAGAPGPLRDIVLLNAAASLVIAGRAEDLRGGVDLAAGSIDSGRAQDVLERLVVMTNQ